MSDIGKPKRIIEVEPEKEPARRPTEPDRREPRKTPEPRQPAKKAVPVRAGARA